MSCELDNAITSARLEAIKVPRTSGGSSDSDDPTGKEQGMKYVLPLPSFVQSAIPMAILEIKYSYSPNKK